MNLITINYENFESVHSIRTHQVHLDLHKTLDKYSEVFDDKLGCISGDIHIHIDHKIKPTVSSPRRIPVSLDKKVAEELDRLVKIGVIKPEPEPTEWVSQMAVTTRKSGDIRICLDPRPLNKCVTRSHYQLPTMDEVLPVLANAKVFSKLDLKQAFWQCKLDEASSKLTTFATSRGRYRWCRLPFGLSISSEEFQKRLNQILNGLDGVVCVADDIICAGVGDTLEAANIDHNSKLDALLSRCRSAGIKLNKAKCEFCKPEIAFLGHLISGSGLQVDPKKTEAVAKLKKPDNIEEIQRFNGTLNYLARFLPGLSEIIQPLTKLTRKEQKWLWTDEQDQAFELAKDLVTKAPVLAFFDSNKPLVIQCDASDKGLGAALLQDDKPIAYASRALRDAETRYAQIEKELLAIVWSLERFDQYTFGKFTTVHSDHKPLETLLDKPMSKAPRRLQGMMMRLLRYDIRVEYKKGTKMHIADMLSRAYLPCAENEQLELEQVNAVSYLPISDERIIQLRNETRNDQCLEMLKQFIMQGWPKDKHQVPVEISMYFSMRDELSVHDGIIFRGERIVVPNNLRRETKYSIHSTHLGLAGTLARARECLYWPGMSSELTELVKKCSVCINFQKNNPKETLIPHELPSRPWEKIGMDLLTFNNTEYLVTVDYYSNFWELDKLKSTRSTAVIQKVKSHFARYGIPNTVISDNGPQFSSVEFSHFARAYDFNHITSSPHYPKSNGKAESAVKSAKQMLKKTTRANSDQHLALLNIRNTPSQGLPSPAQRMFNRRTRTLLPMTSRLLEPETRDIKTEKNKMKDNQKMQSFYYNKHAKDLPKLETGDTVQIKSFDSSPSKWKKGIVSKTISNRSYEVSTDTGTLRRNRIHLRKSDELSTQETRDSQNVDGKSDKATISQGESQIFDNTEKSLDISNKTEICRPKRNIKQPVKFKDYHMG